MKHHLIALLPIAAFAQEMTGPTLGWLATENGHGLQAIHGVAGAARLGPPLEWPAIDGPAGLSEVKLSPSGQRAVALENGVPVFLDLVTRQRTPLGATPAAHHKVWSPQGTALLLASRETGEVHTYVLRGATFHALTELTLAAEAYAISDDGASILAATGDDLLLQSAQGSRVLGRKTSTFAFLAGTNLPLFAEGQELVIGATRVGLPFAATVLASPAAGRILAIDRDEGKLLWLDGQGAPLHEATCHCEIERMEPIGSVGMLRLVTNGSGPTWLAETSSESGRLFFVPKDESKVVPQVEVEP